MKRIDISTPKHPNVFTTVDDADYDWLNQWKWQPTNNRGHFYVRRFQVLPSGKKRSLRMHREIIGAPSNMMVDHMDLDTLNNQRANLRLASCGQNNANKPFKGSKSGYRGVRLLKGRWQAKISHKHLGLFATAEEAAAAFNEAALKKWGDFARLNTIPICKPGAQEPKEGGAACK